VFLVAGIPIMVILWTFLKEIIDIGALDRRNPLGDVAATLLERVDTRFRQAGESVEHIGTALALTAPEAVFSLNDYAAYVDGGAFLALTRVTGDGRLTTYPNPLPSALDAWSPKEQVFGMSALLSLADGVQGVAIAVPVGGPDVSRGRVVGLLNVSTVLGRDEVGRMRVATGGEAFVADGGGRIILSANRHLMGRMVSELGIGFTEQGGRWVSPDGVPYLLGMAKNPGWFDGPHRDWAVGLLAPEAALLERNAHMRRKVVLVMVVVMLVTIALVAVLRRSVGARRK
jgi:hypothetical protein